MAFALPGKQKWIQKATRHVRTCNAQGGCWQGTYLEAIMGSIEAAGMAKPYPRLFDLLNKIGKLWALSFPLGDAIKHLCVQSTR